MHELFVALHSIVKVYASSKILSPTISVIIALCIAPLLFNLVLKLGQYTQRIFNYAFGPHVQPIIGGLGAFLHELFHMICAFLCGHNLRLAHWKVVYDIKHHEPIGSADNYWQTRNLYQSIMNFILGAVPTLLLAFGLAGVQYLFNTSIITKTYLSHSFVNYWSLGYWWHTFIYSCSNAFSVPVLVIFPFLIVVILIASSGFNVSRIEHSTTLEGFIPWTIVIAIFAFFISMCGYKLYLIKYSVYFTNAIILLAFRTIWYLIFVTILMMPFAIWNHLDAIKQFIQRFKEKKKF